MLDSFVLFYGLMISEGICKEFKSKQFDEWSMGGNRKFLLSGLTFLFYQYGGCGGLICERFVSSKWWCNLD